LCLVYMPRLYLPPFYSNLDNISWRTQVTRDTR
jgi:hypothetical protein